MTNGTVISDGFMTSPWFSIVLIIAVTLELVVALFSNLVVVTLYFMLKATSIHNVHIFHMAVCDLLVCLCVMLPHYVSLCLDGPGEWALLGSVCQLSSLAFYALGILSVGLQVQVAIDRLLMVTKGHLRSAFATWSREYFVTLVSLCLMLGLTIPLAIAVVSGRHNTPGVTERGGRCRVMLKPSPRLNGIVGAVVFIPVVVIVVTHSCIYIEIRGMLRSAKSILLPITTQDQSLSTIRIIQTAPHNDDSGNTYNINRSETSITASNVERQSSDHRPIWKTATDLSIVTCLSFLITWLPFASILLIHVHDVSMRVPEVAIVISFWLFLLKPGINPFLYARHVPAFRRRYRHLCRSVREKCPCVPSLLGTVSADHTTHWGFSRAETIRDTDKSGYYPEVSEIGISSIEKSIYSCEMSQNTVYNTEKSVYSPKLSQTQVQSSHQNNIS